MAKSKSGLAASGKVIDPTLDALFAGSSGPAQAPSTNRYVELLERKEIKPSEATQDAESVVDGESADGSNAETSGEDEAEEEDDEVLSEIEDDDEDGAQSEGQDSSSEGLNAVEEPPVQKKDRKRKRKDEHDDLEVKYMRKIAEEEEKEHQEEKRRKGPSGEAIASTTSKTAEASGDEEEGAANLVHESLQKTDEHANIELDKANRTLFLGNISNEAITSSKAKKLLTTHLESPLSTLDSSTGPHKVESLRFRSTAFSTGAIPKRAAYVTKLVMSATTKSTNAYAVYSSPLAARTALRALNGSVILDRHMRVDSVAHPTPIDHRRCVFVGNLGFVDDETVINTTAEGETTTKKRTKIPADTEEGLWRTFGQHAGKVESVRVPRDDKTRVGKGFAYVQFYEANDVESALLLNGKKYPPMLPRILRVSRAKDPRKTALAMERTTKGKFDGLKGRDGKSKSTKHKPKATPEQQSQVGRAGRLFGRAGAARQRHGLEGDGRQPKERPGRTESEDTIKPPEQFVFEGRRASSTDGKPRDLKLKVKGKKGAVKAKTKGRGAKRAAEWRKTGPKK